jgi:3-phenylpropionate/trans-cinnamate dioxygenase ferredoxin subunit
MTEFHYAAMAVQIPEGRGLGVTLRGRRVALFRMEGDVFALDDVCPHAGAALAPGVVKNGMVRCPLHGRKFDLRTGDCKSPASIACPPVIRHEVRVVAGRVEVALA